MPVENSSILHLFTKPKSGSPMVELIKLTLKVGHGIEGDVNANPMSPRQVLIVRQEDILELSIPPGELRENIVITGITSELFVPGSLLIFESSAAVRLTFHCEPCKRVAHLVDSLKNIQGKRGILGVIITAGTIQVGDRFQVHQNRFAALSENPYERFLSFLIKVPRGKVVTYKQIIQGIGVDNSYMRAIPTYLKKTSAADYPIHRILNSEGYLIPYIDAQQSKLETEGIQVLYQTDSFGKPNKSFVNLKEYAWEDQTIYLE
ncbi:hypothetical protein NUACC21_25160 [Scytonema sp. NUACC21]